MGEVEGAHRRLLQVRSRRHGPLQDAWSCGLHEVTQGCKLRCIAHEVGVFRWGGRMGMDGYACVRHAPGARGGPAPPQPERPRARLPARPPFQCTTSPARCAVWLSARPPAASATPTASPRGERTHVSGFDIDGRTCDAVEGMSWVFKGPARKMKNSHRTTRTHYSTSSTPTLGFEPWGVRLGR